MHRRRPRRACTGALHAFPHLTFRAYPHSATCLRNVLYASPNQVTLLQFNWRGNASTHGGPGAAAQGGDTLQHYAGADGNGGGGGAGGGSGGAAGSCVELSDTLLAKPRLLRRFLEESIGIMQVWAGNQRATGYGWLWPYGCTAGAVRGQS